MVIRFIKKLLKVSYIVFFILALFFSKASAVPTFVDSFSVRSEEADPIGLAFNKSGTRMFTIGFDGENAQDVNEYTLSTGFDVSTASFVDGFDVSSQDTSPAAVAFNSDGTKMFVLVAAGKDVNEYTLSTGFDVSTASFVDSFSVNTQDTEPRGLTFNNDGTKMFVVGFTNDKVYEYTLTTGFDVSTSSFVVAFSISGENDVRDVKFTSNGTKMFVLGRANDKVYEHTLTTGFDVSTASFVGSYSVLSKESAANGLEFSADGSKMFVLGQNGDDVNEYTLSCYYGVVNCMDPTSDKDDVASVEAQTEVAKKLIQHTAYPILNRMEWLRRNTNNSNLTNQNIKIPVFKYNFRIFI